mmetsp:Transcript_7314/g.6514  ORF Transcript_7314/g.6514 Transcript_7314/m.6514 type:complete len:140 (+) Transcript_7314:1384-1803(+)
MQGSQSLSIKDNPQYCLNFTDTNQQLSQYDTIITWVVITKMLIKQEGVNEDEEKAGDYIALHAYPNPAGFTKLLEDKHALEKSVYTNEQNYMLYLELPRSEYLNSQRVVNLVLDQHQRKKDLYYNIRVHSNFNFKLEKA